GHRKPARICVMTRCVRPRQWSIQPASSAENCQDSASISSVVTRLLSSLSRDSRKRIKDQNKRGREGPFFELNHVVHAFSAAASRARRVMPDQSPASTRFFGATHEPPTQTTFGNAR